MKSEGIFESVPKHFWNTARSQQLKHELVQYDPSLLQNTDQLNFIWGFLVMQNYAVELVDSDEYKEVRARKLRAMGDVALGIIPCFDGRNVAILQGGRELSYHPAAGSFIGVDEGALSLPRSALLREGIRRVAFNPDVHLLEAVAGHGAGLEEKKEFPPELLGGPCGKAVALKQTGEIKADEDLIDGILRVQRETTIKAVTNQYQSSREEAHLPPLPEVCVGMVFDTFRRGFVLDYDQRNSREYLSTTKMMSSYAGKMERELGGKVGTLGSMAETYTRLDKLIEVGQKRTMIIEALMEDPAFKGYRDDVMDYLHTYHPLLSDRQDRGMLFLWAQAGSIQYLGGLCDLDSMPTNPHTQHGERLIVQSKFKNPFILFPHVQTFASNPPDSIGYAEHARLQVSLMEEQFHGRKDHPGSFTMLLATPMDGSLIGRDTETSTVADNGESIRSVYQDEELGKMIKDKKLFVYPAITDSRNREVLRVPNQRSYAQTRNSH